MLDRMARKLVVAVLVAICLSSASAQDFGAASKPSNLIIHYPLSPVESGKYSPPNNYIKNLQLAMIFLLSCV